METERIGLSQSERDRLQVLHEVKQKHLTQVAAARRLKLSDRQVRRLLVRIGERGDQAVVHRLRGRPSNRKLASAFEQKILTRVGKRYADRLSMAEYRSTTATFALSIQTLQESDIFTLLQQS